VPPCRLRFAYENATTGRVLLTDLITLPRIRLPVEATDKPGVLRELTRLLVDQCGGVYEDVLQAIEERERVLSTGIGFGVAIPHGKSPTIPELGLVCGVSRVPIPYDSLDGAPVRLFFLLSGPESAAGPHVKVLSRIARLVRRESVRDRLLISETPEEFHRAIREAEEW
jgi:mannitol/fructose-specific phosphotransferase system IIA component (Ntr-type)